MPSILKKFLTPDVNPYQFPKTDELIMETEDVFEESVFQEISEDGKKESKVRKAEFPKADAEKAKSSASGTMEYAKVQADAIVEDAHTQAEEILQQARAEAYAELEQLRAQAREEGYREGYAEGMASAAEEAKNHRVNQAIELASDVNQFLERAAGTRDEMLDQTRQELCELAITVAEKVIRVSLKSSSEIVTRMIQGATEKMKRKEWVHIYISGTDTKKTAQIPNGLAASLSALSDHVKIVPMGDDEAGTCIIEMPDEIIDASVSTQLSNIRDIVMGNP